MTVFPTIEQLRDANTGHGMDERQVALLQQIYTAINAGGGGGGVNTQDEGVAVDSPATTLNIVGAGGRATGGGGVTTLTLPGSVKGLLSGRPAAGAANEGMVYHATDVPAVYISDGATWTTVSINKAQVTGLGTAASNNTGDFDAAGAAAAAQAASQPLDSDLTTIAGLTATTDNFMVAVANAWASRTPAQVKTTLAIAEADVSGLVADLALKAPIASPTFTGTTTAPEFSASGLTGAVQASRYVGAVASAAPSSGTFAVGDFVIAQTGAFFVCVIAGTPGTWTKVTDVSASSLFTTKGDLPVGTGAAAAARLAVGSNGQVPMADSSTASGLIYANPRSGAETVMSRTSAISETMPRYLVDTVTVLLATGTVFLQGIWLPKNKLITNIAWTSGTTPAGTPTHWWFTLTNGSRTTLRSTADQTSTAWAASTEKIVALSSTFTTLSEGMYYIGIMMAATTPISLQTHAAAATLIGQAPILCGASSTGQTTAPADATTLTAITAAGTPAYAYVS